MNDDELRTALARRAVTPLSADERNDLIRSARVSALTPEPASRPRVLPRLAGFFVGAVAVVVLVLIALPILLSPPAPIGNSSPSPKASGVSVLSSQELVDLALGGTAQGSVVIADTLVSPFSDPSPACQPGSPCPIGEIVSGGTRLPVSAGYRDTGSTSGAPVVTESGNRWLTPLAFPNGQQRSAFLIHELSVEYLGPAQLAPGGGPLQISDLPLSAERTPSDNVYVLHGWWWSGFWPSCPAPMEALQTPQPELDFVCQGSWITPAKPTDLGMTTMISGALQLPSGVYPSWSDQRSPGQPVEGVFLVRSAGCQVVMEPNCPVWRLLGRLEDSSSTAPQSLPAQSPASSPASSPPPSPTPPTTSALPIASAQALSNLIGDPQWIGQTVLADVALTSVTGPPEAFQSPGVFACTPPDPCPLAVIGPTTLDVQVLVGWRDATPQDGIRYDDGSGYRWVKRLSVPSEQGVYAFTIGQDAVEYLGPVINGPEDGPLAVGNLLGNPTDPSDTVFVVSGWLMHTLEAPCAFPQQGLQSPMPDISSYYCGGSWLTPQAEGSPSSGLAFADGLHVQNDAYDTFAADPQPADGGGYQPRQGVYLIRNAGCPEVVTGDCPVWRMVGRLNDASSPSQQTSPPPSLPTSLPPTLHVSNDTTLALTVSINDQAVGIAPPGAVTDFDPASFAEPWHVTVTTESGRHLVELSYSASDVWSTDSAAQGVAQRLDLSCGRLDVYAGPPLLGPGPPQSFPPNDCAP